jgi:excinuclease ABC subunit A
MTISERFIRLRGVRVHNLQSIDLDLPLGRLIVLSGPSGSGKSSLAFDTIFAEGQRLYVETFSTFTRQFLNRLDRPAAQLIENLPPAIAVSQRPSKRSARSTIGSITEIDLVLALLFARVGRVICPDCRLTVEPADARTVARFLDSLDPGVAYTIGFPLYIRAETDLDALVADLVRDGFRRVIVDNRVLLLGSDAMPRPSSGDLTVVVDRLVRGASTESRRLDSIETALARGLGRSTVRFANTEREFVRGWVCSGCGRRFLPPEPRLFRANSPVGACPTCEGLGLVSALDLERIVPDASKSLAAGAIVPLGLPAYSEWLGRLLEAAPALDLRTGIPFRHLTEAEVASVIEGGGVFPGLRAILGANEPSRSKPHVSGLHDRWRTDHPCPACDGARLRPEALAVEIDSQSIHSLQVPPIEEVANRLRRWHAEQEPQEVARPLIERLLSKLDTLVGIGLGYLSLDRRARTLSTGEARRTMVAAALGSGLVNTLYVLDEPSIGLHARDVGPLLVSLQKLRDTGSTVIVVEHEPILIQAADHVVDLGPGAGAAGGRVLYSGHPSGMSRIEGSLTAAAIRDPSTHHSTRRRAPTEARLVLRGAKGNNLKNLDALIPLGLFCVVAGPSGAGKSSLVEETLYPALLRRLRNEVIPGLPFSELKGTSGLSDVSRIDASPIGRTPRSNPATFVKAYDEIRRAFAATHEARLRNFGPSRFSFNVEAGRCSACEGIGFQLVNMQFLPDVLIRCPECEGRRFRPEVLEIKYRGRTIAEVLDLSAREAFSFFRNRPKIQARLRPLLEIGLDYLRLGQPATTLSGGEAQRLKLAACLATSAGAVTRAAAGPKTLFILDEPTTGLHPADIARLLDCLHSLVDLGHSLLVIEHNLQVIASADWVIELGPEAGDRGGRIVAEGSPESVARTPTHTGRVLQDLKLFEDRQPSSPAPSDP